jgi:uncharacterized protein YjbI with pentapeptide repeats
MAMPTPDRDFLRRLDEEQRRRIGDGPASFVDQDLGGTDLRRLVLQADFERCRFDDALLLEADMGGALLGYCSFRGADLSRSWLTKARLHYCDLEGAVLREAHLAKASIHHSSLRGADLTGADVARGAFHDCDLRDASLVGLDLQGVAFDACRLAGADFSGTSGTLSPAPIDVGPEGATRLLEGDAAIRWLLAAGARDIHFLQHVRR